MTESDPTDLSYFAAHHLAVLSKAVDGLHAYIARKANEQRQAEALLHPGSRWGGRLNHRQRELLMHAVRNPGAVVRIAEHQRSTQVTYQTARSDLLGLQRAGLFDLHKQGRSFAFTPKKDLASILGV